jgi:hypothetical protein
MHLGDDRSFRRTEPNDFYYQMHFAGAITTLRGCQSGDGRFEDGKASNVGTRISRIDANEYHNDGACLQAGVRQMFFAAI